MARNTSTRYQNALTYTPGRNIGFYPDQAWNFGNTPAAPPVVAPTQFAPGPVNALAQTQTQAPGGSGMASGATSGLLGTIGIEAIRRLGNFGAVSGGASSAVSDPYLGSSGTPVDPQMDYGGAIDEAMGYGSGYIPSGFDFGTSALPVDALGNAGAGVDAAMGAFQMPPAGGWTDGASMFGQAADAAASGAEAVAGGLGGAASSLGGALGAWGGGVLAADLVEGDPEEQPMSASAGGAIGGAVGTYIMPGIGTAIGAFLGALAGGVAGAGSPDYPYNWDTSEVGNGGFSRAGSGAGNHTTAGFANQLGGHVNDYVQQRAQAEGLQFDPYYAGEGYNVGSYNNMLTYQRAGLGARSPGSNEYDWQGDNPLDLANTAYGDLVGRGILTATPQLSWDQYAADQAQQQQAYQTQLADPNLWGTQTFTNGDSAYDERVAPTAPGQQYSGWSNAFYSPPATSQDAQISGDSGGA